MSLVVTHVVSGDIWAGAEVQVFQLIKALVDDGHVQPTAVVFNDGVLASRLTGLGIPVTVADESTLTALQIVRTISRHVKSHGTQVVHTHGFKENVLGVLGQRLAGVRPSLRTVHGNPEHARSWRNPAKKLADLADIFIGKVLQHKAVAVSGQLEDTLGSLFPGKTQLIHNFVDVEALRRETPERKGEQEPPVVGLVGRMVPVKRADLFVEAVRILRDDYGRNVKGLLIGDGPLRADLETTVNQAGLQNHISFTGFLDPALPTIATLDALVMPSDHEGLPMTLIEVLALEIPVVAHKTGGIPEALGNGDCGTLVTEHSARGYAAAINEILANPESARNKASAGLDHVRAGFDKAANGQKYIDLYQSLAVTV